MLGAPTVPAEVANKVAIGLGPLKTLLKNLSAADLNRNVRRRHSALHKLLFD